MATNESNASQTVIADGNTEARVEAGTPAPAAATPTEHRGFHPWHSIIGLMGYGNRGTARRKHTFVLCCKLVLGLAQIVSIAVLSAISLHKKSPMDSRLSEWDACNRPLGPWVMVWLVRVVLGLTISVYNYFLVLPGLAPFNYGPNGENEDAVQGSQVPPPVGPLNGPGQPQFIHAGRVRPIPRWLQSLTTILSFLSLVWFVASHIMIYTSLDTCRRTSPHLWWLAFAIMSIAYVLIVEVLVIVFFLFFFIPTLLLLINLLLLCLGRRPLFRANGINHEIGKLPQEVVQRIPLVFYIPTPPPKEVKETTGTNAHTYPPTAPQEPGVAEAQKEEPAESADGSQSHRRHRFFFLSKLKKSKGDSKAGEKEQSKGKQKAPVDEWEANWERGEYPFVKLPENRATCAICLLDFEEPPRRGSAHPSISGPIAIQGKETTENRVPVESLSLQDAGEGATPLRLLACGHAFHQTCLDPWLKDVSGRCPVCQRKVDIEELERLSKRGTSTAWATEGITPPEVPTVPAVPAASPAPAAPTEPTPEPDVPHGTQGTPPS
ncbi:hypothetical protein FRC19_005394 [Serendipita sp. 401]|nr:hypothetical protein FRC19_005394 [Serendipita sp. 401]